MVHLSNIKLGFGGRMIFDGLTFHIKPQDRIGLIGPNGTGKTTLLRIVTGELEGYDGEVQKRKGVSVACLPQDGIYRSGVTVLDCAMEAFAGLIEMENEIKDIDSALLHESDEARRDALLAKSGDLRHEFEMRGGFTYKAETAKVLTGLGFHEPDLARDMETFSGGWQMRVALAKLLLMKPDVLLLDEPTNHLDLPAILWFESFLTTFPGALVVVSHDRWFLDRTVKRIAELGGGKMSLYAGNYSFYVTEKEKRLEILLNSMENQQREIRRTERFIERFRYKATKARQVQSRIKMLDKLERIEAPETQRKLSFSFKAVCTPGVSIIRLADVCKSYGDNHVLRNVNLGINRGERVAVVGANGLGKSTLMRVIADRTDFTGDRKLGHNVSVSYFSQDQYELLSPDNTVLDEAESGGSDFSGNIRSLLGIFMFSDDEVNKKVAVLSGGEKSRLLLAKMMAAPANFLILDEPTNHLDPPSQLMLEEVFNNYDGTICFVSHNRSFIDAIATRVIEISEDGIDEYIGNYSDYEYQKRERLAARAAASPEYDDTSQSAPAKPSADRREQRRERARFIVERSRVLKPVTEAIEKTESEIHALEARAAEIESLLADPETYKDPEKCQSLPAELKSTQKTIAALLERWEELGLELEEKSKLFEEKPES